MFRDAVIIPIPKGGNTDLSQSSNYRGIALASCFSKLLHGVLYFTVLFMDLTVDRACACNLDKLCI